MESFLFEKAKIMQSIVDNHLIIKCTKGARKSKRLTDINKKFEKIRRGKT